jgi:hypothetical protein
MLHCIRNCVWIAPIFVLAGCWQKIEYTGKPVAAAKAPVSPTIATSNATETKPLEVSPPPPPQAAPPTADVASVPPAPDFQPPPATPPPAAPTAAKSKPADVDRYAITVKADDTVSSSRLAANDTRPPAPPEQQSPQRHTDATPVSATVDVAEPSDSAKVRRAVWTLGSRLSLAALAHDRHMAANSIPTWLDEAHSACKVLGTTVPELPEPAAAGDTSLGSRQVIDYLLAQGQRIGGELAKRYGPEQAALFEVALKSNILLLLYSPGSDATNSIAAAISRAAPQAELPDVLWWPLIERISRKDSLEEIRTSVRQMHRDVDKYLAKDAEPGAR